MVVKIITILITLIIGVGICYFITPYIFTSVININEIVSGLEEDATVVSGAVYLLELLPTVFTIMICIGIIATILYTLGLDPVYVDKVKFQWNLYGERLKKAYAANFYGANPGFNEEIDARISILVESDRGFRRQLALDYIKRMSKFVGVEWLKLEDSNLRRR